MEGYDRAPQPVRVVPSAVRYFFAVCVREYLQAYAAAPAPAADGPAPGGVIVVGSFFPLVLAVDFVGC